MPQPTERICLHEGSAGHPDLVAEWQQEVEAKTTSPHEIADLTAHWLLERTTPTEQLPVVNNEIMSAMAGLRVQLEKQLKAGEVQKSKETIFLMQSLLNLVLANIIAISSTR
jgi:hypothetical protein